MARLTIGSSIWPASLSALTSANGVLVGEERVDLVLGLFLALEVLVLAGDVGVPPGAVGGDLERPHLGGVGLDELPGFVGRGRIGCGDGGCHDDSHDDEGGASRHDVLSLNHGRTAVAFSS